MNKEKDLVSQSRSVPCSQWGYFFLNLASITILGFLSQHCSQVLQLQLLLFYDYFLFNLFWLIYLLKTNLYTLVSHYPIFQPRIVKSATQSVYDLVDIRTPQSGHRGSHCRFCFHSLGSQDPGKQLKTKFLLRTFLELNLSPNITLFYLYTGEE